MQGYGIPAPSPNVGIVADVVQANNAELYAVIMALLQPLNEGLMRSEQDLLGVGKHLSGIIKKRIKQNGREVNDISSAVSDLLAYGVSAGQSDLGTVLEAAKAISGEASTHILGGWGDPSTGVDLSQSTVSPLIPHEAPQVIPGPQDRPRPKPPPSPAPPSSCPPGFEFVPDDQQKDCILFKLCPTNETVEHETPYVIKEGEIPGLIPGGNNTGDLPEAAELFELPLLEEYDIGSLPG